MLVTVSCVVSPPICHYPYLGFYLDVEFVLNGVRHKGTTYYNTFAEAIKVKSGDKVVVQ